MEHLSENTIKKAALRFLNAHYKFRPRSGKATSSLDIETSDGIIVDGSLSFLQEDGTTFTATFEATSAESKGEVIYKIQSKLLLWDSLAVAFLVTSMVASFGFSFDYFTVKQIGWAGSLSLLTLVFAISFLTYQYLFKNLKRYRYIYAVEQFKRYHADEQWIAVGEDVFAEATDPELQELKAQCVINGFGLILIDHDLETTILITPSRQQVSDKKRSALNLSEREVAIRRSPFQQFQTWWDSVWSKRPRPALLRYQRSYWNQILLCLAALLIISSILIREAKDAEIAYVDEEKYEKDLLEKAKNTKPEPQDFVLDTPFVESPKGKGQPYILVTTEKEPDNDLTEKGGDIIIPKREFPAVEILVATLDGEFVAYDCERFFNYSGTKYLIQEGEYSTIALAQEKMKALNDRGINANCMWTGCFSKKQSSYVVFIDLLFDKNDEAKLIAKSLSRKFRFADNHLQIRPITLQH